MEKHKAIPQGYMTVGEVAKKMGVTVRTLQYYDKEGLLSPSAESEGGRRLYTDKDLVTLHQIMSLKSLGFSLDDIKQRLIYLETPTDVAKALTKQADDIRRKIEQLTASLTAIEQLKAEVLQMQTVSFKKYADIMEELSESNDKTVAAILKVAENVETTDASVRNISDAVELISNVAEQTNLLSLNASIEAARAGDAGKGFAVVAMEIQKLSSESNDSAQKISQIITQLSADSHNSLTMMEEVKRRLQEQQEKLNATKNQFGNVNNGIISSREGTNAINGQAKICDQSRSSVVDIITNLSAVSQENVASTEETTASMQQLNAAIDLVAEASIRLKNLAVSLTEATKFFQL